MQQIDADAVRWREGQPESGPGELLVVMHGIGSHEGDLFGLAPHLPAVDAAEMHALRQRTADQQREVQRITSATLEGRFLAG